MAKINKKIFIERYYKDCNESKEIDVNRFLLHIETLADEINVSIEDALKNKAILIKAFYIQGSSGNISRSHYQKIKKYISDLMDMYNVSAEIPSCKEVIDSNETIGLFGSLDDLLNFIDKVGEACLGAEYNPLQDLIVIKTICILSWNKFSPSEIIAIKADDLQFGKNGTYTILHKGQEVEFSKAATEILKAMCKLETYKALPSGKKIRLVGNDISEYLLRPAISAKQTGMRYKDEVAITSILSRFNKSAPSEFNKVILLRNLKNNASFLEIYHATTEERLNEKIMRIMQTDRISALSYEKQYLRFAESLRSHKP